MRKHLKQHYQYALENIGKTCQVIRSVYRKSHIGKIWKGIGFIFKGIGFILQVIVIIILTVIIILKVGVAIIAIPLTLFLWIIRFLLGAI